MSFTLNNLPYPPFKPAPPPLISLAAASANPMIKYHSVKHLDRQPELPARRRQGPKLISLADANATAEIKYRSVEHLKALPPVPKMPLPQVRSGMTLVPLWLAAARDDIKYRMEGFELQAHRRHILAVRAELF